MISIKTVQELNQHPEFIVLMQAQIQMILWRKIQVRVLESYAEYQAIEKDVEAFSKRSYLVRGVSPVDYLDEYVLFPWKLGTAEATVFYIPVSYVKEILLNEYGP